MMTPDKHDKKALLWEIYGLGIVVALAFVFLGSLLFFSLRLSASLKEKANAEAMEQEARSVPVAVMPLVPSRVVDRIRLPGRMEAWAAVDVPAEVAGPVIATKTSPLADGSACKKGDIILQIDPKDYRIALREVEAATELAERNYERTRVLVKRGARTRSELDRDDARLKQARASLDAAKLALARCLIRSPLTGIVDDVMPEPGEFLTVGMPVARVLELGRIKVDIGIPERDYDAIRQYLEVDRSVSLTVNSIQTETGPLQIKGTCYYLSRQPAELALVYRMRVAIDNTDRRLQPGMFVEADVIRGIRPKSLVVPLFAVLPQGDAYFVYLAGKGKNGEFAAKRQVTPGVILKDQVEILNGLKAGELLIVSGQRSVEDQMPIRVVKRIRDLTELRR